MKCNHYKGEGYTYKLSDGQEINLCNQCEMDLLIVMRTQEIIENKTQMLANISFEKEIEELKKRIEQKAKS